MKANNYSPKDLIASPCQEKWCEMTGDERARFCDKCQLTVVNLTGKSIDEIRTLQQNAGGHLCGRFDLKKARVAVGAGIASLALASCDTQEAQVEPPAFQGAVALTEQTTPTEDTTPAPPEVEKPEEPSKPEAKPKPPIEEPMIMGGIRLPAPPLDPSKQA